MKIGIITLSVLAIGLTACASSEVQNKPSYDAKTQARIRLYGQNGRPSNMEICEAGGKIRKEDVGGSLGDAVGSFIRTASNQSIGIVQTEASKNVASRNALVSKAFYREFVIPAGQPVNLSDAILALPNIGPNYYQYGGGCTSGKVSFTPEAGHDYEMLTTQKGAACGAVIVLDITNGGVLVQTGDAVKCR